MIYYDLEHGSDLWFEARLGIATASCFNKIITPKTGKMSSQADGYANQLIAEIVLGQVQEKFPPTYWMERGSLMEDDAKKLYEFETGYNMARGGFATNDTKTAGASPDMRVFDADGKLIGGAEIKCPAPWTQIENLLRDAIDPDYIPQVQGQILIYGFEFVDWFSYHPDMPPALIRTYRDDEYCEKLEAALHDFHAIKMAKIEKLKSKGMLIEAFPEIDEERAAIQAE